MTDLDVRINEYVQQIGRLWPFPPEKKQSALENLKQDVRDTMRDKSGIDPTETFGDPYVVAKDISFSHGWAENRASHLRRVIAFVVDMLLFSVIFILEIELYITYIGFSIEGMDLYNFFIVTTVFVLTSTFLNLIPMIYFIICEGLFSKTLGKKIVGVVVCDISGVRGTWSQVIICNLSKWFILILLFELLVGWLMRTDKQRALDVVAETIVVKI